MGHSPRQYESTHPWLTFTLDTRRFGPELWMLLGEVRSKIDHIAGVPLRPATSRELHTLSLAKGLHGTTAIEGNTLSEEQVRQHLAGNLHLPPSQVYLQRELDNIVTAFNTAEKYVIDGDARLTPDTVCTLNGLILSGLELPEGVVPGAVRTGSVGVGSYLGPPAQDCHFLLQRLCSWLGGDFNGDSEWRIPLDILRAVLAHLYIAWIHPFGDGNGRTGRLLEAVILMAREVPTPAVHLLSNHYNITRTDYYRRLDEASQSPQRLIDFLEYSVRGFVDQLGQQINVIRTQQRHQAWQDHIEAVFKDRSGPTTHRQRLIALELGRTAGHAKRADIPRLSPEIGLAYVAKTPKTITRDLNALAELGLVKLTQQGYVAQVDIVSAFLPERTKAELTGEGSARDLGQRSTRGLSSGP